MKKPSKKQLAVGLVVVVLVVAGAAWWKHEHPPRSNPKTTQITKQGKRVTVTRDTSQGEGGATDKNGASVPAPSSQSSAKPVTSSSGVITLDQPTSGSTIKSGDGISGTAKVGIIQFRLIDDSVGVIAQGQLNVTGGKFSGILRFQNKASSGRLDVFSLDPSSGAEINEVQVPVKF